MVTQAESLLDVRFPSAFVEALRRKNGGSILGEYVPLPPQTIPEHLVGFVDHGHISIAGINGVGSSFQSVLKTPYMIEEWQLPKGFVLLDGDGHTWIAFDYRSPGNDPRIVFLDSESGDTLFLAKNFEDFSSSLIPHEDLFDDDGKLARKPPS